DRSYVNSCSAQATFAVTEFSGVGSLEGKDRARECAQVRPPYFRSWHFSAMSRSAGPIQKRTSATVTTRGRWALATMSAWDGVPEEIARPRSADFEPLQTGGLGSPAWAQVGDPPVMRFFNSFLQSRARTSRHVGV